MLANLVLAAPSGARDLSIGMAGPPTSFDPHFHVDAASWVLHRHVFEPLIQSTPDGHLEPGLAHDWIPLSQGDGWEVRIDPEARFQDGTPVTAADVVATLERVATIPNSPGRYTAYLTDLLGADLVDARTLRLRTRGPAPLLPNGLAAILVVPERIARSATTAEFNAGTAAVGSGPYRLLRYRPGEGVDLKGDESWWQARRDPTLRQTWSRVRLRVIPHETARVAALLAGDADVIEAVPARDRPRLVANPSIRLAQAPGLRLMYVSLSHSEAPPAGMEGPDGRPLTRNPLRDVRVRRALSVAIDRSALALQIMDGQAMPAAQIMRADSGAADPELRPRPLDRDAARQLLKEAGWGGGFRMTLSGTGDRFPNDERIVQALAQMWRQVGVETRVQILPATVFLPRLTAGDFAAALSGWLSGAQEPNSFFTSVLASRDAARGRGSYNAANYAAPRVDALINTAMATVDRERRHAAWRQAARAALEEDVAVLPLFHQVNVWAMRRGLTYAARSDGMTLAAGVRTDPEP